MSVATATLLAGAAVPTAVLARIVVETAIHPSRHNLWPMELLFAGGPGWLAAFVGARVGKVLARPRDGD